VIGETLLKPAAKVMVGDKASKAIANVPLPNITVHPRITHGRKRKAAIIVKSTTESLLCTASR
jgi:hypothetical protein